MSRPPAGALVRRSLATGTRVAVSYLGADFLAHSRVGRVVAIEGSRFTLAYQDPAGTTRRARFDLANPHDVVAVEAAR